MKKVVSYILLLVFLLQLLSPAIIFSIVRRQIKEEVAMDISLGNYTSVVIFLVSSPEWHTFQWEDEKEFFYQDAWYDVIEIKSGQLFCIKDVKETSLLSEWKKFTDPSNVNFYIKLLEQQLKKTVSIITYKSSSDFTKRLKHSFFKPLKDLIYSSNSIFTFSPPPEL